LYSEEVFYKTHKISRKDFAEKLENAQSEEERQRLIGELYEDES
jgi:hypothetical protein